jgi:hypothetical protein
VVQLQEEEATDEEEETGKEETDEHLHDCFQATP